MSDTCMTVLFGMFMALCLGFMVGWVCGEEVYRRRNAEAMVEDLSERLEQASSEAPTQHRQLKEMRGVLNDVHKHILAVSKALRKPAP
jgi:hypothetical protein